MISILIPTINRSEFVRRALQYYAQTGFNGWVCLGDSSNEEHQANIRAAIQSVQDRLHVIYRYFPSPPYTNAALCLRELIELVPTPYAVYSGDDDFLVPRTLEKCAAFLKAHPDYSAVNGLSVALTLNGAGAHGEITEARSVGAQRLESPRALERWVGYVRQSMSTQYYVHSLDAWRRMYRDAPNVPSRYLGPEFLPGSLSAILGKITDIDELACVFQVNQAKNFGWRIHSLYALMMSPQWTASVHAVRESIIQALMEQDGLSREETQRVFDQEFWRHLNFMLQGHYRLHHPEPLNVYDALKRRRWLVEIYRGLQNRRTLPRRPIPLKRRLRPGEPLHDDFMPVYQAITAPPPRWHGVASVSPSR